MKKYGVLLLSIGLFIAGCRKSDNGVDGPDGPNPDPLANVVVQDFMWKAMNIWYFWQSDVPDLDDNRFTSDADYTGFLESESDPASFFDDKLRFFEDRFSFYNNDFKELTNSLSGVSRSNGLEFGLFLFADSDDIFGYVRYIIANSDASGKGISRGDLFTGVDGQTLNLDNYRDLLFGENATYTLNMADIDDGVITPNGNEVILTKEEALVENPVFIVTTFEIGGKKIGYFMYNGFTNEFDEEMNEAFGQLKSAGVTDLVLDLRYNPGGSVNSSRLLCSMIYGTHTDQLYIRQRWNDKIQQAFTADDPTALEDYFASTTDNGTPINSLNLTRLYVLTTGSTASASELVINGLNPYIDVVKIGTTTTGKNEFSLTMVDDPSRDGAPYIYSKARESSINSANSWAIQPLVGMNENSAGFSDYTAGFTPDIEMEEDLENFGVLGDMNEPLLARAIDEIVGTTTKRDFTVKYPVRLLTSSKMFKPIRDDMVLDKQIYVDIFK